MQIIYIEKAIMQHPRVAQILQRIGQHATVIECQHYQEVFNPKSQNFRFQKQSPALILAQKSGHLVMPTPEGFGIGGAHNYYFSHMLNCLYDCRYCFLQGMYPSAHYVVFVNYEDFMTQISATMAAHSESPCYFFSGYDGDSLVFDQVTGFLTDFVPFFAKHPQAILELRTKSTQVKVLLSQPAIPNCIVAFSLTPESISQRLELGVPPLSKRLKAMQHLAQAGWSIGLRFDPLIYVEDFSELYQQLITQVFQQLPLQAIHSVSVGPLRFPQKMYQRMVALYPDEKLFSHPLYKRAQHYSYAENLEIKMKQVVITALQEYIPSSLLFTCSPL